MSAADIRRAAGLILRGLRHARKGGAVREAAHDDPAIVCFDWQGLPQDLISQWYCIGRDQFMRGPAGLPVKPGGNSCLVLWPEVSGDGALALSNSVLHPPFYIGLLCFRLLIAEEDHGPVLSGLGASWAVAGANEALWVPYSARLTAPAVAIERQYFPPAELFEELDRMPALEAQNYEGLASETLPRGLEMALTLCGALASPAVTAEAAPSGVPASVNARRIRDGKIPLLDYREVIIDIARAKRHAARQLARPHGPPGLHDVRPFLRRHKGEAPEVAPSIAVRAHKRGDPARPIDHHYRIRPPGP